MRETINQAAQELSATPPQAIILLIVLGVIVTMIINVQFQKEKERKDGNR